MPHERLGVSNHRQPNWLLKKLSRPITRQSSKPRFHIISHLHRIPTDHQWIPLSYTRLPIYWSISQLNTVVMSLPYLTWSQPGIPEMTGMWQDGYWYTEIRATWFFWLKTFVFCFKFHWDLFPQCHLTTIGLGNGCKLRDLIWKRLRLVSYPA